MADVTLSELWTNKSLAWKNELAAQLASLATATASVEAQQALQAQKAAELATEVSKAQAIRAQLARIPMPGDGDPLLVALETSLVQSLIIGDAGRAARRALDEAQARVDIATAAVARAQAEAAAADAALARSTEDDAQWAAWRKSALDDVANAAPKPLPAAADDLLKDATTYGKAKTRVESDFGAVPKTLAFLRATEATELASQDAAITTAPAAARAKVRADLVADKGLDTAAAAAAMDLDDALATLRYAATEAAPAFAAARATVDAINAAPPLSAGEAARIAARAAAVEAKPAAFNAEFFAWAAAVPEEAWQRFMAFEEVTRTLTRIKALDVATPATGINDVSKAKETALANALIAAGTGEMTRLKDEDAAELARRFAVSRRSTRVSDLVAAIRGDGKH